MHFAVLCARDSWYYADLARAAAGRDEITPVSFRDLHSQVIDTCSSTSSLVGFVAADHDLRQFDAVLIRTMPQGSLEQVVFRMDVLAQLEAAGQVLVNPPRAIEVAVDKYLATARLAAAGLPTPPTWCGQTVAEALGAFDALGGDVVVKPLFGSEGRGMSRLTDLGLAERAFSLLHSLQAAIYLQKFIPHEGYDLRLLVIGEQVLAMRRRNASDWRTNVSRGAVAEAYVPTAAEIQLARRAAAAVGASVAGVDLLPARDGNLYVLEVNAVPGWKALAAALNVDVAALVLDHVRELVRRKAVLAIDICNQKAASLNRNSQLARPQAAK